MALLKKRKFTEDEQIYSDDVSLDWKNLFESGEIKQETIFFGINCGHFIFDFLSSFDVLDFQDCKHYIFQVKILI